MAVAVWAWVRKFRRKGADVPDAPAAFAALSTSTSERPATAVSPVMEPLEGLRARPGGRLPDAGARVQVFWPEPVADAVISKGVETLPFIGPMIVTDIDSFGSFGVTGGTTVPSLLLSSLTRKLNGVGPFSATAMLVAVIAQSAMAARRRPILLMAVGSEGLIRHFTAFP